jgi:type II secretory ATPase GspE/PulE/Tfp pilus assembly ATPase PilB-like protein
MMIKEMAQTVLAEAADFGANDIYVLPVEKAFSCF